MEIKPYSFDIDPNNYQPSGRCDFSKIYNPKSVVLTYTDHNGNTEKHIIERTEIINKKGNKKFTYIFPAPFKINNT